MSFDLYSQESEARIGGLRPIKTPEPGAFEGFFRGAGMRTMRTFAETARAGSLIVNSMAADTEARVTGDRLAAQDKYFKQHDETFQRAVDYWTPKPGEVGAAGEIVGQLLGLIPQVIAAPAVAVAGTQLSVAEDLVRKGVDSGKAGAVGAAQAGGLGLGIWMPILGQNLWQRVALGGAGFNVLQGTATRAASGAILEGTPAADDFKAFDGTAVTLDALLGLAFGGLAHLSPAARAQGERAWRRIESWTKGLQQSEVDAIATLRQAQHLNVDSAPGLLATHADIDAHVQRIRTAIDQLAADKPVDVADLPAAQFKADPARAAEQKAIAAELGAEANRVMAETGMRAPGERLPDRATAQGPESLTESAGDPLQSEAQHFAESHPEVELTVGRDADGQPIRRKLKEYLEEVDATVARAHEDAKLFDVAAACLLGAN